MSDIGNDAYLGLFTKTENNQGRGRKPGQRSHVHRNGDSKEFVAVKVAAGTWINGTVVLIDGPSGAAFAAVVGTAPAMLSNGRCGILVLASATSTQTVAGTSFGWAQVYGQCMARVSTTVSLVGVQLVLAADPGELISGATVASTETQLDGITAVGTQSVTGLLNVFLSYPRLRGTSDTNLA